MNRFFIFLFLALFSLTGHADEISGLETVETRLESLKNADPTPSRDAELATLQELKTTLSQREQSQKNQAQYQLDINGAPAALDALTKKLAAPAKDDKTPDPTTLDIRAIEQRLGELQAQQASAQSKIAELNARLKQREQRLDELPKQLATAQEAIGTFTLPEKPLASAPRLEQTIYNLQLAKEKSLKAQADELILEQQYYNATDELLKSQLELAKKESSRLSKSLEAWQKALETSRAETSRLAKIETDNQAKRFQHIPVLAKLTSENAELARYSTLIVNKIAETNSKQATITAQREETRNQRQIAQERLELLESAKLRIDTATAALLRYQRAQLPSSRALQETVKDNIRLITEAQVDLLEINKNLADLPDSSIKEGTSIFEKLKPEGVTRKEITALLNQHRDLMQKVRSDLQKYTAALQEYNRAATLTLEEVKKYTLYLDERLLWIPSAPRISTADFHTEGTTALAYFQKNALPWLRSLGADALRNPALWAFALIVLCFAFVNRRRSKKRLAEIANIVNSRHCTTITPTLSAIRHTLFLSLFLPLLLLFIAWRSQSYEAINQSLIATGLFLFLTGLLRRLTSRNGVLPVHFGVSSTKAAHFHYHLNWFLPLMGVFILLTFALPKMQGPPEVGRLSFIASMIVLGTFAYLIFRPGKKIIDHTSRFLWFPKFIHFLSVAIPTIYIIGAALGYILSIYTLREKLATSIWFGLAITFTVQLLIRWILVSRRRLAREQAVKKYEALIAKKNAAATQGKTTSSKTPTPTLEELEANAINPVKIEEQTTRLVRVIAIVIAALGLWAIWSTTLPALSVLDNVIIWGGDQTQQSDPGTAATDIRDTLTGKNSPSEANTATDATFSDSQKIGTATTEKTGITLQDLLVTFFIIALTISAAGNLPGLLELSLLRKIDLQPGSNYAITTVLRYLIIVIGLIFAFGHVGISWSSVQWLAAAVTLGIGFGLQEIFANFVAGIILLFERPIRLGDLVTVGDVSGKVTQIQIRATTILQFNNRELLVPNKEFITGQLVNWTLHDSILRFELPVGIAYGSDTALATKIFNELLENHPHILKTPGHDVLFKEFGPSTLDFTLRAYVASPDTLISTQSELHYQIDNAFREADIDIAIPQQDIYIKSLPPEFQNISLLKPQAPSENPIP